MSDTIENRRWDNDTRGYGIADGGWIVPSVKRLLDALTEANWVAENPDQHLLPHLNEACEAAGPPWTLTAAALRDGVYVVALEWNHSEPTLRLLRADAYALIGVVAEGATFIYERRIDEAIEFHVTTGLLDGDTPMKGHGHLLHLRVGGPTVRQLIPASP